MNLAPVASGERAPFLPSLRAARDKINKGTHWVFSPDARAAEHVAIRHVAAPKGSLLLLSSDGFLAPVSDYGRHTAQAFMDKAVAKGLAVLGDELREIEDADPNGHKYPRFKKSDDATAVLLKLI